MKTFRKIIFSGGVFVMVWVLVFLSAEKTSRISTTPFGKSILSASKIYSMRPPAVRFDETNESGGGAGQIYFLALHVAALMGLSHEKASRNETDTVTTRRFAVVGLFTSEGCSSCPPADELVKNIQRDDKTGQVFVLAYHVDYWDHQGWKDKFGEKEFSKRQTQYARWLNLQTIYTPQIVVNGMTEHIGSDKRAVLKAISKCLAKETTDKFELSAWIANNEIHVESQSLIENEGSELVLTLIQKSEQVDVKAGENMGMRLFHVQIVRKMIRVPLDLNGKKVTIIKPPVDFAVKGWEIIGFVQRKSSGLITAAHRIDFDSKHPLIK